MNELQRSVSRIKQALGIQGFEIDDLEAVRASDTQLRLQEMYRTRLEWDVELLLPIISMSTHNNMGRGAYLENAQRIVTALQQLPERRFCPPSDVLLNRLQSLNGTRQWTRLDDTNERLPEAHASLEEGYM